MTIPLDSGGGGLRKVRRTAFLQIPSTTIRDKALSFRARGVLAFLLDHPDGWKVDATSIAREGREGREAVEGALRELRAAGYYRLERRRLPRGGFAMGTAIAEEPIEEWAAAHLANGGGAVVVRLLEDGSVVDVPTSEDDTNPQVGQGNGFPGPGKPGPGNPAPKYLESETDSYAEGGSVPEVSTEGGPQAVDNPPDDSPGQLPSARCADWPHPDRPCHGCRDAKAARQVAEQQLAEERGRQEAARRAAEHAAARQALEDQAREVEACDRCDADGFTTVTTPAGSVGLSCRHGDAANGRAAEARLAARAATPTTRAGAGTRARARARAGGTAGATDGTTDPTTQEA